VPKGQAIVEIGSWKGKSTLWLAKGAEVGHKNKVFAIDPHRGSRSHVSEGEEDTYPIFLVNLAKAKVKNRVVPLVMTSVEAARFQQWNVGLLWIDGSHEYEDVKHDFFVWKQYLSLGAVVALHDCDKPGPAYVAQEYLVNSDEFVITHHVDTILAARKCR
jgi:predicted O-methyltransferase YrrM